jgi:DNA repair photolyase
MSERATMNGKPVHEVPAKTVINFHSGFAHKLLCDGPTFSLGTACAYSCAFCYVPDMMRKQKPYLEKLGITGKHENIVIRRHGGLERLRQELTNRAGSLKFPDPNDRRVIYSSPSVDVAANMDLVRETIEACMLILQFTHWQIRLLSKSNLLPKIARGLYEHELTTESCRPLVRERMIFGVSTGTLDDKLALSFEQGTPLPSKRIASLHWLQDNGFRTFGMICPSLPQTDYGKFAADMHAAIRADRCEHVWAEVINVRGDSMKRTCAALWDGGYGSVAMELERVSHHKDEWESYARATFLAHAELYPPGQLRFLQYADAASRAWWAERRGIGAILL